MTKNNSTKPTIVFGIVLVLFLLTAGCITKTQPPNTNPPGTIPPSTATGWLAYSPVQAQSNPWQVADISFTTTPTELERVQAWLSTINANASTFVFVPHDEITCAALNCPRGDYLLVNPSDAASQTKLLDLGFFVMNEPFVFAKNVSETGTYTLEFVNASNENIFYGGCNEYIPQKLVNGVATPIPPKVCVWEGIPAVLNAGKTISFDAQSTTNGTYNVTLGYGTGCASNQPLSQAACTRENTLTSNTFVISNSAAASGDTISMTYDIKQCNTNPWQEDLNEFILVNDKNNFTNWLTASGIVPLHIGYAPAPEGLAVCLACSCPSGETYRIIVSSAQQAQAEALGFEFEENYIWPLSAPNYAEATWRMYTPYQCFANKWNVKKESVRNIETDFSLMKEWMNEKGVNVSFVGFIRGYSLSQQCTKISTDRYGVGVLDSESSDILSTLGFVVAGPNQTKKFTLMEDTEETMFLYKTKFCQAPPWGALDLSTGNEAAAVERAMQWLADAGIPSYEKPTIHKVGVSATGSCGTDSGLSMYVNVPAWAETHILPHGFGKPSFAFDAKKSQVWPVNDPEAIAVDANE